MPMHYPSILTVVIQDLKLTDENREMVHKGTLNKRDGEIHVYLFDHSLLFTKLVKNKNHEQFKVYRPVSCVRAFSMLSSNHESSPFPSSF
jgi:Pleckstrin homology domain